MAAQPVPLRSDGAARRRSSWPHRLAVLTAAATMVLIVVGGLVTNTGSALAVPDWPTTFGYNMFTFPWSRMVGGIFFEHAHRLLASTVGMMTIVLALGVWRTEPRRWVRRLGVAALAAVLLQGVLGGLRVVLLDHDLAPVHGCVAQAFFGLLVVLSVVTSPAWEQLGGESIPGTRLRGTALATIALVYVQLVFGAVLTHTGQRLDAHLLGAALVAIAVAALAGRLLRTPAAPPALRRPAALLLALLLVQLGLGLGAYLWHYTALPEAVPFAAGLVLLAAHRLVGTALWAAALVVGLRVFRGTAVPVAARDRVLGERMPAAPGGVLA